MIDYASALERFLNSILEREKRLERLRKAMAATVGPRAAQSAQRRLPSLFKASLTARVLRSIVSWEGIARLFFGGRLAGVFGLAPWTGAFASRCALVRGWSAVMCASVSSEPSAWA